MTANHAQKQEVPKCDPGWYHYSAEANTVYVFVHGLLSDASTCWVYGSEANWPALVCADPRLGKPAVFVAQYHTGVLSGAYSIADCARELLRDLQQVGLGNERSVLSYTNIVFVCHSMGGIVVRYMLDANFVDFSPKAIGLLLMASPSVGSEYALRFGSVASIFKQRQVTQLRPKSETLCDLDDRFKDLIDRRKLPRLVGAEAIEANGPGGPLFGLFLKPIVTRDSAGRYFGAPNIIPGTDHGSIVKPKDLKHTSHTFLVNFVAQKFAKIASVIDIEHRNNVSLFPQAIDSTAERVLFDIYDAQCREHYYFRPVDDELAAVIKASSVWVWGTSGSGKTSAVRYLLSNQSVQPITVDLANWNRSLTRDTLLSEIAGAAAMVSESSGLISGQEFQWLVKTLAHHSRLGRIPLYLDEVPISPEGGNALGVLVPFVADLLSSVKSATGDSSLRFMVSSIAKPSFQDVWNCGQLAERMSPIAIPEWSEVDLENLLRDLLAKLPDTSLTDPMATQLIINSAGSPRFMKSFFRSVLANPGCTHDFILANVQRQYA